MYKFNTRAIYKNYETETKIIKINLNVFVYTNWCQ